MENNVPKVGVGVFILKDGKLLLGKRKNAHGEGQYATPGGHLEYMESFEDCVRREIKEECGIIVKNIRFQYLYNMKEYAPKHYVHVEMAADWESGEPQILEPDKIENWQWYDLDNLPTPRFRPIDLALTAYKTGQDYFVN